MNKKKYSLIVPVIVDDLKKILTNMDYYFGFLPIKEIVFIGDIRVKNALPERECLRFIDERELVDYKDVERCIADRKPIAQRRTGWYLQQFIKMKYAFYCEDEYYLLWDADTIPTHQIHLFTDGHPIFDMKTEFHKAYFDTIEKLFPGAKRNIKKSFIAEHMLVKTSIMKAMVNKIEENDEISGRFFYEKIISAIEYEEIELSGFSEFETFGNFVVDYAPDLYRMRKWTSMRYGGFFFDQNEKINENTIAWLAQNYDAVSMEKGHKVMFNLGNKNPENMLWKFSPKCLEVLAAVYRIKLKVF